jgi:uncharacterized RDD family membrane protein YckC
MGGPMGIPANARPADAPRDPTSEDVALSPARRSLRFAAALVDVLFCACTVGPGWVMAVVRGDGMRPGAPSFVVFIGGLLIWQGAQAALISVRGQSLGKYVFGLRIVLLDGARVGFVRGVLLRSWPVQLATQIPTLGYLVALGDALTIFRPSYRCLHDDLAGTTVIEIGKSLRTR